MKNLYLPIFVGIFVGVLVVYGDVLNAGFEAAQRGTATNIEYWSLDVPPGWIYGGNWGEVDVQGWRAHSGTNEATIHNWGGGAPDGGWWQTATDTVAYPGSVWIASAWAVSDAGGWWPHEVYTAVSIDIKIEFYASDHSTMVGAVTNSYDPPGETWTYMSVTGMARANSHYARFVIVAVGQGTGGAFQFDDTSLALIPEPSAAGLLGLGGLITVAFRRRRRMR